MRRRQRDKIDTEVTERRNNGDIEETLKDSDDIEVTSMKHRGKIEETQSEEI